MPRTALRWSWLLLVVLTAACSYAPTDADLRAAAMVQLAMDPATTPYEFIVKAADGVVSVEGRTNTRAEQQRVVEIVRAIEGVKDVQPTLTLMDSVVQAAVVAALQADPVLGKIPIEATVSHGSVRLESDSTGPDERSRAIEIATAIDGVVKIDDFMR